MPELPEVETIRRDLDRLIVGKKILEITTDSPKQVLPSLEMIRQAVVGAVIKSISRRAKLLQIFLDNGKILAVHLKLTGRLLVRKKSEPVDEWQRVIFKLKNGDWELRFCDLRRFGYIRLLDSEKHLEELLKEFGPEPLTPEFTLEKFKDILFRFGRPVKLLLMDQAKIAGMGNIYANEALFLAGIAPHKRAREIPQDKGKKLYKSLKQVLEEGIRYRGASDNTYLDAFGQKGEYQEHLRVYGKEGESCPNKCGGTIRRMTLGGRGTFFCPRCQK